MSFLLEIIAKAASQKDIGNISADPGGIYSVAQGTDTMTITVIGPDTKKGFWFFQGNGKPKSLAKARPQHSGSLTKGFSAEKVGEAEFKKKSYQNYSWVITGFEAIDSQMAEIDDRFKAFTKFATKDLKELKEQLEDINHKLEAAKVVEDFCDWLILGGKPKDFVPKAKLR